MISAREMGMSEKEFYNSCPIFFVQCYQEFLRRKQEGVNVLYGR